MTDAGMHLARFRNEYRVAIREAVDRLAQLAGIDHTPIGEMLDYQMNTGGKRLRAVLPLMVADALDTPPERLVAFGASCELIHNATLVHDDLQDGDRLRRGEPTVWAKFGEAEAINLGDAVLMLAPLCLEQVDTDDATRWRVASRMCRRVLRVVEGQQREFALCIDTAGFEDYRRVVAGKTSGLFALPIVEAAVLCGAGDSVVEGLEEASGPLGVLFQIQDDILDLYGQKGRETPGGDLREGKISALVVEFAARAPREEIQQLRSILQTDRDATTDENVRWAAERFRKSGALEAALARIEQLREQALSTGALVDHPRLRGLIENLCDVVVEPIADLD